MASLVGFASTFALSHTVMATACNQPSRLTIQWLWQTDGKVVFVTGGAGDICSAQTKALVRLGANACIIGRNVEKTESKAKEIAAVRPGAKVIGIGGCDVRSVRIRRAFVVI
jgi:NADPH:quinone reductase-like Zn-dependent oxidoreductase